MITIGSIFFMNFSQLYYTGFPAFDYYSKTDSPFYATIHFTYIHMFEMVILGICMYLSR